MQPPTDNKPVEPALLDQALGQPQNPSLDQALDKDTLSLAMQLMAAESISPDDAGCQSLMADYLTHLGFRIEHLRYGDVDNLWALHGDKEHGDKEHGNQDHLSLIHI